MVRSTLRTLGALICSLLLSVPLTATEKSSPTRQNASPESANAGRSTWPAVTLKGKIILVDLAQHLIVVKDSEGVPFDLKLTSATLIRSGDQGLKLEDIRTAIDKNVSVKFTPERSGNVTTSIQILTEK
jgi:hypothetical protein